MVTGNYKEGKNKPVEFRMSNLTYIWCCVYSLELLMMDGKTVRNMLS